MIKKILLKIYHKWRSIPEDRIYLALLVIFGCVCLTVTGSWHVYTAPVKTGGGMLLTGLGIDLSTLPWEQAEEDKLLADADENEEKDGNVETSLESEATENLDVDTESDGEKQTEMEKDAEAEPVTEEAEPWEPVFQTVGDDYFDDAVFIGDSRTVGMYNYSNLKETSTFYASVGLSVHKLFTAKIVEVPGQHSKITVEQALSENQFAKVYLMIGINEMGTGTVESFLEKYAECVQRIRELQPDAIIYLQGIMQVTENRSAQGDYITNAGIVERNEGIKALADEETIFYLEVNEAVCDETGALNAEYTGDGVHLKAQYVDLWKEYLKNHAIIRE